MTDPQVIWRRLRVPLARSVSFPDQTPAIMQVSVIALANPSSPQAGTTFVAPSGVQDVALATDTEVVFDLIPSHLAGLSEPLIYRIQWRAGITGRTVVYDFAMPDQDVDFFQLDDLGKMIDGENYLQHGDLGVPGRVARLNLDGHVVDANGQVLATTGALTALSGQLQAERLARQQGDISVAAAAQQNLETQITSALNTTAANLAGAVAALDSDIDDERGYRMAADQGLHGRVDGVAGDLDALATTVVDLADTVETKAPVIDGKIPAGLVPDAARVQGVPVADQAAMLALTSAQIQQFDYALRPDGVFLLRGTNPATLSHWTELNKVNSVNGHVGDVALTLADIAEGGTIAIDQVEGLQHALDNAGDQEAFDLLEGRVGDLENDPTVVKTVAGVIPHALNDEHMAYVNADGRITNKAGDIITVPGEGNVSTVNSVGPDEFGDVALTLTDVAAAGGQIGIGDVAGLGDALATPAAHAASHAADGDDPLALSTDQVTGLDDILDDHEGRIAAVETSGGGGGGGDLAKANWYQAVADHTGVETPADFQSAHNVTLRGPFTKDATGTYAYNVDGVAGPGETYQYVYITPNGHLQLRTWDEDAPPDPEHALASDLSALTATVSGKAAASDLTALQTTVSGKASQADLDSLAGLVGDKADQSDLDDLADALGDKADQSDLDDLADLASDKADQSDMLAAQGLITALQTGKADLVGTTVPLAQLPDVPTSKVPGLDAALAGKAAVADLTAVTGRVSAIETDATIVKTVGGKIPTSVLPSVALTTVTTVANKAAMLAQTSAVVQPGDLTIITMGSDRGNYILTGTNPAVEANWVKLVAPEGSVSSVNGQTGTVVLSAADVGARSLGDQLSIAEIDGLGTALDSKASTTALTSGLAGKTSPGDVREMISTSGAAKQQALRVATVAVASLSGAQSIDGALVAAGNTVLLTAQASSAQNGLWQVNAGAWTRPADFANGAQFLRGTLVTVAAGSTHANTLWQQTTASGTIGTNNNNWAKVGDIAPPFAPVEGNGIAVSGSTFAVRSNPTSQTITVSAAGVAVNTNTVPQKRTGFVPAGSTTATVTHNLNTNSPIVQIIEHSSNTLVAVGVQVAGVNAVTVEFASAPASNQYRYVIVG